MIKEFTKRQASIEATQIVDGFSQIWAISSWLKTTVVGNLKSVRIWTIAVDGFIEVPVGNFIIKQPNGTWVQCSPEVFEEVYEEVKPNDES